MNFTEKLQEKIDQKTKPLGALGQLEDLAFRVAWVQQSLTPQLRTPSMLVFAGDHGIARAGVSAYPPEVTHQMVLNFLSGGAAINVFARQHDIALHIVDAGVQFDFPPHPQLIDHKIAPGTRSFLEGPAMSTEQLDRCLALGAQVVDEYVAPENNVLGFGEMGIGNTSAASLLMAVLLDLPLADCVGRGTGLNDAQVQNKLDLLERARAQHPPLTDPREVLRTFGGFEMAQMCGAMLAAGRGDRLLLVDGFIATAVFLVAQRIEPQLIDRAVFCHLSDERAHGRLLAALGGEPLLRLHLRLGEGTGCALAYPLLQSACAFLNEMASFAEAGVSSKS
ncbi:MAG: nicotinate-nucleotide--dimethylbenzimidazole phosphoribosyltransferase [Bacteroidota bacterium]